LWGFLTGWAAFTLSFSAAAAAMVVVAVENLDIAFAGALSPAGWGKALLGPLLLILLATANVAGARVSRHTTMLLTALPLVGLGYLFGYGLLSGDGAVRWPAETLSPPPGPWPPALGAAMLPVFFTFSGWNAAAYVAGEIREPQRNLPRGLFIGASLVTILYLAVNVILITTIPPGELAGATFAGTVAAGLLLGPDAQRILAFFVALAVLGSTNVTLMAGARIYYAMGCDGLAPRALRRVNRAGVPHVALWAGAFWSAILASTGTVERLVSWATLAILLLSALTVVALFVLRRRQPHDVPFRCPGYPVTPALYLGVTLAVAIASAWDEPRRSLWGVLLILAGIPFYALVLRRRGRSRVESDP
jgi:APA family basic amino acid/polyamine antiporter